MRAHPGVADNGEPEANEVSFARTLFALAVGFAALGVAAVVTSGLLVAAAYVARTIRDVVKGWGW